MPRQKLIAVMGILAIPLLFSACAQPSQKARTVEEILKERLPYQDGITVPLDNDSDYIPPMSAPHPSSPRQAGTPYQSDYDHYYWYPYPGPSPDVPEQKRQFKRPLFY